MPNYLFSGKIFTSVFLLLFFSICLSLHPNFANAQTGEWRVWVKTSPCSGRNDWITVAKMNPTPNGPNFYYEANTIYPGSGCNLGCTFEQASAAAASLRSSNEFFKYCCHDYSVWQNSQTGKMSVVAGKFGTAGPGWSIVKADLCCEEAEALSGIAGACSGSTNINHPPAVQCGQGTHAVYNKKTRRTQCFCNQGLVWNTNRTACIQPPTVQCWPGSYAVTDPQTGKTQCYCNPGLIWNETKTACIVPATNVNCWPGSYAAMNPQTGKTECYCNPGLVWNDAKTACITPPANNANCWPGSYAAINPQTGKTECYCNAGLVWNESKTACVTPTGNIGNKGNKVNTRNNGNNGAGTWVLVSATVDPPDPKITWPQGEWNYSAGGSSAHYSIYAGTYTIDYSWTPPPGSFGSGGFSVSMTVQGNAKNGAAISATIGVSGSGLTADKDSQHMGVDVGGKGTIGGSQSVNFKPGTSGQVEVKVSMGWAVSYTYKYERR